MELYGDFGQLAEIYEIVDADERTLRFDRPVALYLGAGLDESLDRKAILASESDPFKAAAALKEIAPAEEKGWRLVPSGTVLTSRKTKTVEKMVNGKVVTVEYTAKKAFRAGEDPKWFFEGVSGLQQITFDDAVEAGLPGIGRIRRRRQQAAPKGQVEVV